MNVSKVFRTAVVAAAAVFAFGTAQAQTPDQQFGLGILVGDGNGITAAYALTPAIHVGLQLSYVSASGGSGSTSSSFIAPYGKFLFMGPGLLRPFINAQFASVEAGETVGGVTSSVRRNYILAAGGAEYFFTRNLGAYGQVRLLQLGLDPSTTTIGLGVAQLGIEYFF
jgi:hypothetical protein